MTKTNLCPAVRLGPGSWRKLTARTQRAISCLIIPHPNAGGGAVQESERGSGASIPEKNK